MPMKTTYIHMHKIVASCVEFCRYVNVLVNYSESTKTNISIDTKISSSCFSRLGISVALLSYVLKSPLGPSGEDPGEKYIHCFSFERLPIFHWHLSWTCSTFSC